MTSHHLTVAKATFAASLLRPDVTKINRDELPQFHNLLETAAIRCSPSNIQKCKQWLLSNIIPSQHRTTAFAKYLTTFARHLTSADPKPEVSSSARQRLHLLYLLNDLLHHAKYHASDGGEQSNLVAGFKPQLVPLFQHAAVDQKRKICRRLRELLEIWQGESYFDEKDLSELGRIIDDPSAQATDKPKPTDEKLVHANREVPFLMPATHGDPSLPYHELPAGNLMPHIVPNRTLPMRPDMIRPLQFATGAADESLVNAVKDFMKDVDDIDNIYNRLEDEGIVADIDDVGQISYRNEAGDQVGDTYYGWSKAFCDKMKSRSNGDNDLRGRSRSRSSESDRSYSRSFHKRRRYSHGSSRSNSLSQSPRRSSRSRGREDISSRFRRSSRSSSAPRGYRPVPTSEPYRPEVQQQGQQPRQVSAGQASIAPPPFHPPPLGPNGMPIPPPRPPNWTGPWPPPPPPPPPTGTRFGQLPRSLPPQPPFQPDQPHPGFPPTSNGFSRPNRH